MHLNLEKESTESISESTRKSNPMNIPMIIGAYAGGTRILRSGNRMLQKKMNGTSTGTLESTKFSTMYPEPREN